ncbi:MAG: FtsX-like permease family protein [Bacteroidales bacterium]|jgi:ABC-type antimicrobial peptide transport system permease subunit|nr:FtsX-like permease family protein [Bacteroidales bacterium]
MSFNIYRIVLRSVLYYRAPSLYQFLIILVLSSIISGSLLTGKSVRISLRGTNIERLNGTQYTISAGDRYFPLSLSERMKKKTGGGIEGILETTGWASNLKTGISALDIQVHGINDSFFSFGSPVNDLHLEKGEAVINSNLASKLEIVEGEDIILRFPEISEIPLESPFTPEEDTYSSLVLTVKEILESEGPAGFSLGINQAQPLNVFVSLEEFSTFFDNSLKINRILVNTDLSMTAEETEGILNSVFMPADAGFSTRQSTTTGMVEILSERIFLNDRELEDISEAFPGSGPVLTYLVNELSLGGKSTPYSFISALPEKLYDQTPGANNIIINTWLADDLGAGRGDSLSVSYYTVGPFKKLTEKRHVFVVSDISGMRSKLSDSLLMPPFPGISGRESCSNWDAGFPIDLDAIRDKDEDYWNKYRGTPKAYINYDLGKDIWVNNFGRATSVRLPSSYSEDEINDILTEHIKPGRMGFRITDIRKKATDAARNSVDFSTLFLGLSFFIILSCLVLLVLVMNMHFEDRKKQVSTLSAMGFGRYRILKILLLESGAIALAGSLAGIFTGLAFNKLIIKLLNSVWKGAVQTDTLQAFADPASMIAGMAITLALVLAVIIIKLRRQLRESREDQKPGIGKTRRIIMKILPLVSLLAAHAFMFVAILTEGHNTELWFIAGSFFFISFLFSIYRIINRRYKKLVSIPVSRNKSSWSYYAHHPSRAITPALFLGAGLFTVIVTGANRKSFDTDLLSPDSGTGAYILWGETVTPLVHDLDSDRGRYEYNLEGEIYDSLQFIQIKRKDGDDASCLNLNQAESPPILGIDITSFVEDGAFSFASSIEDGTVDDPWLLLREKVNDSTVYGILDQTVMQWNLFKEAGDTINYTAEDGTVINVIIAAGLKNSVFQGNVLMGLEHFNSFFPSVGGSNIFLVDGSADRINEYREDLAGSLSSYGVEVSTTYDRLASFSVVTNTYLSVFMTLGGFGLLMGVLGMGFVLLKNLDQRKQEYALMLATGFSQGHIRKMILREHLLILAAGIIAGTLSAIAATLPSLRSGAQIPLALLIGIIVMLALTGSASIYFTVRKIVNMSLTENLRKE